MIEQILLQHHMCTFTRTELTPTFAGAAAAKEKVAKPAAQVAVIEPELIPEPPVLVEAEVLPAEADQEVAADWKTVVGLSALLAMICSVDRAAMSVALGPMGEQFMWSDTVKGTISSSFFIGYTLTNFVGAASNWSGPRVDVRCGGMCGVNMACGYNLQQQQLTSHHICRRVRGDALQPQDGARGRRIGVEHFHAADADDGGQPACAAGDTCGHGLRRGRHLPCDLQPLRQVSRLPLALSTS